jgi:DNA-binding transcriptional regulator YiaG
VTPKQIKALRSALGLTQEELAAMIGAYQETVARWESGANKPKGAYLKALKGLAEKARHEGTKRRRRQ